MTTVGLRIGRYEIGERLGKGGFGVVHVARDLELGREVAIKFLRPEYMTRVQVVQRFLQEARACAKIGHPGIVTVFEAGIVEGTGQRIDGTAFIVMERLRGESLGDRLRMRGRQPAIAAIGIARQLAAALHVAHGAGIIHRDLKPDNVYLVRDAAVVGGERVKILDFGVAKLSDPDPDEDPNTHSHMMLGTPRYMSPEQARGAAKVDHRTDIYALGCLVYELVCGKTPFGGDVGEVLVSHQTAPITPPRELVTSIPAALDELIVRMLAKDPDARPPTMRAVDDELDLVYGSLAPKKRAKTSSDNEKTLPRRTSLDDDKTTLVPEFTVDLETPLSMNATIIERPRHTTFWWRWRFAIGAASAILSGVIVFLVMRKSPREEPVRVRALVTTIDANDEPTQIVVGTPDAADLPGDAPTTDALVELVPESSVDRKTNAAKRPVRRAVAPPPPTGLPTPLDACDPDTVAAEERRGDSNLQLGNFPTALAAYEKITKCRPEALRKAYLSACRARAFPKAKRYFKLLTSDRASSLAQICMKEGFDPRT